MDIRKGTGTTSPLPSPPNGSSPVSETVEVAEEAQPSSILPEPSHTPRTLLFEHPPIYDKPTMVLAMLEFIRSNNHDIHRLDFSNNGDSRLKLLFRMAKANGADCLPDTKDIKTQRQPARVMSSKVPTFYHDDDPTISKGSPQDCALCLYFYLYLLLFLHSKEIQGIPSLVDFADVCEYLKTHWEDIVDPLRTENRPQLCHRKDFIDQPPCKNVNEANAWLAALSRMHRLLLTEKKHALTLKTKTHQLQTEPLHSHKADSSRDDSQRVPSTPPIEIPKTSIDTTSTSQMSISSSGSASSPGPLASFFRRVMTSPKKSPEPEEIYTGSPDTHSSAVLQTGEATAQVRDKDKELLDFLQDLICMCRNKKVNLNTCLPKGTWDCNWNCVNACR